MKVIHLKNKINRYKPLYKISIQLDFLLFKITFINTILKIKHKTAFTNCCLKPQLVNTFSKP